MDIPTYSQSRTIHLDPGIHRRVIGVWLTWTMFRKQRPSGSCGRRFLRRRQDTGGNTIMVTSALPREGKTITAINLAFTFAREFQAYVLPGYGDLRKQSIHKYLGCAGEKGLIDYLVDGSPVSELITWPGIEKMTLISEGGLSWKAPRCSGRRV